MDASDKTNGAWARSRKTWLQEPARNVAGVISSCEQERQRTWTQMRGRLGGQQKKVPPSRSHAKGGMRTATWSRPMWYRRSGYHLLTGPWQVPTPLSLKVGGPVGC